MAKTERKLGLIPQPDDDRDYIFGGTTNKIVTGPMVDVDMRKWCSLVEDQGATNSCTGQSVVGALELLRNQKGLPKRELSRLFAYYNGRAMRGDSNRDIGAVIRFVVACLNSIGSCNEAMWPFNVSKVLVRPPLNAFREAYSARISRYEAIKGTGQVRIAALADALAGGCPVVFGINVTESFMYPGSLDTPKFTGRVVGGHAMTFVGYQPKQRRFIVRNSWGRNWSMAGYCYMPEQALDDNSCMDVWVIRDAALVK